MGMSKLKKFAVAGGSILLGVVLLVMGFNEFRQSKKLQAEGQQVSGVVTDTDVQRRRRGRSYYLRVNFKTEAGETYEARKSVSRSLFDEASEAEDGSRCLPAVRSDCRDLRQSGDQIRRDDRWRCRAGRWGRHCIRQVEGPRSNTRVTGGCREGIAGRSVKVTTTSKKRLNFDPSRAGGKTPRHSPDSNHGRRSAVSHRARRFRFVAMRSDRSTARRACWRPGEPSPSTSTSEAARVKAAIRGIVPTRM